MLFPFNFLGSAFDPNAQAFISAAGITNPTQQNAINQLVIDLKTYGLWTKMKAVYPMVGGTSSSCKYNLINPQDTDAAFRLVFNGGWTFDNNGATPNGTNGYADTKFIPSSNLVATSQSSSIYSRTNSNNGSNANVDFSAAATGVGNFSVIAGLNYVGINGFTRYGQTRDVRITTAQRLDGYFVGSRISSVSLSLYRSNVLLGFDGGAEIGISNIAPYIGAENNNGLANYFTNRQYCFAHIGDGLTDTDASNLYTAVQTFQTTLNRYVGVPIVSDANAQAFLNAAQITDITQANAVNTLVQGLKADGLWTKMKAVYPMVGGTASSCKYNLVNPQDTDAAFRLVFNGGWTFDNNGATPNGTNAYADTKLIPSSSLIQDSTHLSFYSRNNITTGQNTFIGSQTGATINLRMIVDYSGTSYLEVNNSYIASVGLGNFQGFFNLSRILSTQYKLFKNGSQNIPTIISNSTTPPSYSLFISACNNSGSSFAYSNNQCAFSTIGDGLTDTDALNLYNRVQTFQTSLSRQV